MLEETRIYTFENNEKLSHIEYAIETSISKLYIYKTLNNLLHRRV